jgi:glycosyltransferase involved in cell wall biosynthesis
MPCFNHARFVVESAEGILRQTLEDLELIIVDDCSSDNSWEVIQDVARKDPRVKAIRHARNQGASKSRNDGLLAANGEFIGFCDADDIWEKDKLRLQVELLRSNPTYDLTYCDSIIIDENGLPTGKRFSQLFPPPKLASGSLFSELLGRNFINMQSVLMRKGCLNRVGYFDEKIKWVEDWWYWVRISRDHRFLYYPAVLARYRVHSKSTSVVQRRGYRLNRYKVFKRILHEYADISRPAKADIRYEMGVDLYGLGKNRAGRAVFLDTIKVASTDIRAFSTLWKALARMIIGVRIS